MARWFVKLDGDVFDLEEFPLRFPKGDVHAVTIGAETFLTGPAFENFDSARQVRDAAFQVLDEMSSVISLLFPSFRRPVINGSITNEDDDGNRKVHHVLMAEGASIRSKCSAVVVSVNGVAQAPVQTQAEELLEASRQDRRLQLVLSIWADPIRTWPRLYRLLEELETVLGQKVHVAGLCTKSERGRFTQTANNAEIAGKDARHGTGKFDPPKDPMSLAEATDFVRGVIVAVLRQASDPA